jgi:hypothetical protein
VALPPSAAKITAWVQDPPYGLRSSNIESFVIGVHPRPSAVPTCILSGMKEPSPSCASCSSWFQAVGDSSTTKSTKVPARPSAATKTHPRPKTPRTPRRKGQHDRQALCEGITLVILTRDIILWISMIYVLYLGESSREDKISTGSSTKKEGEGELDGCRVTSCLTGVPR